MGERYDDTMVRGVVRSSIWIRLPGKRFVLVVLCKQMGSAMTLLDAFTTIDSSVYHPFLRLRFVDWTCGLYLSVPKVFARAFYD